MYRNIEDPIDRIAAFSIPFERRQAVVMVSFAGWINRLGSCSGASYWMPRYEMHHDLL